MNPTPKSKPDYAVYVVEGERDKAHWIKIGAGWSHSDGEGINLTLAAVPLNGRLIIRKPKTERDEA
jgi:hypothetical protein